MLMAAATTALAGQTNTLDTCRQAYERQQQSVLAQYGKALDAAMADAQRKGDLDGVLILQAERKRLDAKKTVPAPADAKDAFRPASEAYYRAMVALLGRYVSTLDGLIRTEVAADRMEDAKAVKVEKDKTDAGLADMRTKVPGKESTGALPKTNPNPRRPQEVAFSLHCPTKKCSVKQVGASDWRILHVGDHQDFWAGQRQNAPFYVRDSDKEEDELIISYEIPSDYGGLVQAGVCVWDGAGWAA